MFITDTTVPLSQNVMVEIFVNGEYTEYRFLMRTFTLEVDNNDDYDGAICGIDDITTVINRLILRKKFYGIWHLSCDQHVPVQHSPMNRKIFFSTTNSLAPNTAIISIHFCRINRQKLTSKIVFIILRRLERQARWQYNYPRIWRKWGIAPP